MRRCPPVAAGNLAIAFGDFAAGYVINDRFGVRILRDPYTNKPFVHFYATKRVGAGVMDPKAIRLLKIAGLLTRPRNEAARRGQ